MILLSALLLFDMFGLHVERIGDVTKDGVDEIVIADPCGDRDHEREGRVLIVDPTRWAIVHEITNEAGETGIGSQLSVSRSNAGNFLSVSNRVKGQPIGRVRLVDGDTLESVWTDDVDLQPMYGEYALNATCIADADGPALYFGVRPKVTMGKPDRLEIWRRNRAGRSRVGEIRCEAFLAADPNLCAKFDEKGVVAGLFVSLVPGNHNGGSRYAYSGKSRIDYLNLENGDANSIAVETTGGAALGLASLPSRREFAALSGDALAVCRTPDERGRVIRLSTSGPEAIIDCDDSKCTPYWGTSMCWIRDVDGDASPDLVIGCPHIFDGEVLIIGSANGARIASVQPSKEYPFSFGTNVCSIADQDGDGLDDLVVSCVSWKAAHFYAASLSIVSTRTWQVTRLVYEKDLARVAPPK